MNDWLGPAMKEAQFELRRQLMRTRDPIDRLLQLDLRDRWGYRLGAHKLAAIAAFIQDFADHEGLRTRSRERGAMVEMVDTLATAMLVGDLPMFCSAQDTPPEDELIETVVRTTLNLKEPSA